MLFLARLLGGRGPHKNSNCEIQAFITLLKGCLHLRIMSPGVSASLGGPVALPNIVIVVS